MVRPNLVGLSVSVPVKAKSIAKPDKPTDVKLMGYVNFWNKKNSNKIASATIISVEQKPYTNKSGVTKNMNELNVQFNYADGTTKQRLLAECQGFLKSSFL